MEVWPIGNDICHVNEVALRRARPVLGWVTVRRYAVVSICNSHPGQLSLLPLAEREINTRQGVYSDSVLRMGR